MSTDAAVYLVEDNPHVQTLVVRALKDAGIHTEAYDSPSHFLQGYDPNRPGCLVLDLNLPEMNGLELLAKIREIGGEHPFLAITGQSDVRQAVEAIQAGAVDYLEKPFAIEALIKAIRKALRQDARNRVEKRKARIVQQRLESLTPRENQVLRLLMKGKLSKQIASELGISTKTVDVHRSHLLSKMHVRSVVQLSKLIEQ